MNMILFYDYLTYTYNYMQEVTTTSFSSILLRGLCCSLAVMEIALLFPTLDDLLTIWLMLRTEEEICCDSLPAGGFDGLDGLGRRGKV
jgi:hypothetical protein